MNADIDRHLESLEAIAMQLLRDIGELRRDVGELTARAGPAGNPPIHAEVLDRLVEQLGNTVAAQAVVRSYIDALPARIIAVSVSDDGVCGDRSCGATTELRLASELVGATAMVDWCCERDGEPPITTTLEGLERWLVSLRDDG